MGFLTGLAEQMTTNLLMFADTYLVECSKILAEKLEKVEDDETQETLREYREDIREIALAIHQLASKLAFDEMVDPEVAERLRASLSTRSRRST